VALFAVGRTVRGLRQTDPASENQARFMDKGEHDDNIALMIRDGFRRRYARHF
jgi:hypothetical protein